MEDPRRSIAIRSVTIAGRPLRERCMNAARAHLAFLLPGWEGGRWCLVARGLCSRRSVLGRCLTSSRCLRPMSFSRRVTSPATCHAAVQPTRSAHAAEQHEIKRRRRGSAKEEDSSAIPRAGDCGRGAGNCRGGDVPTHRSRECPHFLDATGHLRSLGSCCACHAGRCPLCVKDL